MVLSKGSYLARIEAEVMLRFNSDGGALFHSFALGKPIDVRLRPTGRELAEELHQRYGPYVALTVGFKPSPPDGATGVNWPQPRLPLPSHGGHGLEARAQVSNAAVQAGENMHGDIWLTNVSDLVIGVNTDSVVGGLLIIPETGEVGEAYSGYLAGAAVHRTLIPREAFSVSMIASQAQRPA